jgi:hypothetical protein
VDRYSQELLLQDSELSKQSLYASSVTGDGNCLFNAASWHIAGNESIATELRVRTAIEMVDNENLHAHRARSNRFELYCATYEDSIVACAKPSGDSNMFTISALASVLHRPIISLYPRINHIHNPYTDTFNMTLNPIGMKRDLQLIHEPIYIMWTRSGGGDIDQHWRPNHFVPVVCGFSASDFSSSNGSLSGRLYRPKNATC